MASMPIAGGVQTGGTPCNVIPAGMVNPIGASVIRKLYPTPNTNSSGFNYSNQPVRKLNEGTWDIRLDHNFNSKDSAFTRFSYDQATNFVPGGSPTWSEANAFGSNQHIENHGRNVVVTETHVFSPNFFNQATAPATAGSSTIFFFPMARARARPRCLQTSRARIWPVRATAQPATPRV